MAAPSSRRPLPAADDREFNRTARSGSTTTDQPVRSTHPLASGFNSSARRSVQSLAEQPYVAVNSVQPKDWAARRLSPEQTYVAGA